MQPERVVCVLGMHRSGTSCLTGSLQGCGLALGQHSTWNPHNLRGNRENDEVIALHEAILSDNGGCWNRPPKRLSWSPSHRRWAAKILATHQQEATWGFKDPRTLLLIDGWRDLLGPRLICAGIFRHPHSVTASLNNRGEFPSDQAYRLWFHYNRLLLREYRRHPMALLCFDWPESLFQQSLTDLAAELGLERPAVSSFYSEDLRSHRHQGFRQLSLPNRYLYWRLRRLADRQVGLESKASLLTLTD